MSLRISSARPDQLDALDALLVACIAQMREQGIDQWDDVHPTRQIAAADLEQRQLFVATLEGQLAGSMVLNTFQDPEYAALEWKHRDGPALVVHRLMVDPVQRGRGVALALMNFAEGLAAERGHGSIRLDAFSHNPRALELYTRLGYRRAGEITLCKGRFHCFEKAIPAQR